jgi:hypothetical protein
MNVPSQTQRLLRMLALALLMPIAAVASAMFPQTAHADTVDCMLPGEIHNVGGHPTMGPRRPVQTTEEDCKQRGGEYTVPTPPAPQPQTPVAKAADTVVIRCLLPRQTRQLGSSARYTTRSRIVHTTASDCQTRQGRVLSASKATH